MSHRAPASPGPLLAEALEMRLYRARETRSEPRHGGWFRPGCLHLLQVVDGRFTIDHPGTRRRHLGDGEAILVAPGTRYHVCVAAGGSAPIRYAHCQIAFFGSLLLTDLAELPVLLPPEDGVRLGDAIAAAERTRLAIRPVDLGSLGAESVARAVLLHEICRHARFRPGAQETLAGAWRLAPVLQAMHERLEEPLTRGDLARVAGLSPSRFSLVFRAALGKAPMRFLRDLRLQRARLLLARPGAQIQEIAERLCFTDAFHFSKAFKQAYGLAPSAFRRETFVLP